MRTFPIADDLVELVWRLAKPEPFEKLDFNDALRRVLAELKPKAVKPAVDVEKLLAELAAMDDKEFAKKHPNYDKPKRRVRAPSPHPDIWLSKVPELASMSHLRTWRGICDHLQIEVGRDSARRKLADWVSGNRPTWPPVPDA
ncbi:hypothetical protein CBM2615_A120149 [Cupriavidus taiwanensis]|uniref:Uncharacterized protein n=1 Tax=Cupriavidus taiwanensis TaxID=164546 RepID=A0A976AT17_9BURK|nr:hypothetical protein [Cupriavidus taiwanensis]SOZ49320.1 hypothetical protein CBM2615_A120149 [Cupriavidus taiwanensis]SOZ49381.1 hypothetical protein CBM2614_A120147 [Cupriavidus taiwanensis]SOZ51982.1 hypothetical protein CBM2613_A110148 [Cupriavidus taiwanensis]SPA07157.1 hypothetical protein CBM2625_A90146 [Cupriavidus taiwanensis]